jgi:predicted negative regulator of RcsB-dependent stress response
VHAPNNPRARADERLQRVATSARDEYLRPIARLRLARVQAAQEQYDAALATLGTADMQEHEAARLEVRGDILFARGDREGALKEYLAARERLPSAELQEGGVGELLDLKIADVGGKPPATPAEPEATP